MPAPDSIENVQVTDSPNGLTWRLPTPKTWYSQGIQITLRQTLTNLKDTTMSKKDRILSNNKSLSEYPLNVEEKNQLNALITLIGQSQMAQDLIYSNLVQSVAARYEISDSSVDLNIQEVMTKGADPKLMVRS